MVAGVTAFLETIIFRRRNLSALLIFFTVCLVVEGKKDPAGSTWKAFARRGSWFLPINIHLLLCRLVFLAVK